MAKYLGQSVVNAEDTEFKDFISSDWVLYFIEKYGQFDGGHHKQWVMDQVVRLLKGTQVIIMLAKWSDGFEEYRVSLDEPTEEYRKWVSDMTEDENGEIIYGYDEGIAP